jgi:TrwC relaxase
LGVVAAQTQYNLKNAKEYFEEHLCVGDYYTEGQQVTGEWFGLGGERLGLSGKVRADEFIRLCENQNPATGETLTQRLNTTRVEDGKKAANRRIFYDFTFSRQNPFLWSRWPVKTVASLRRIVAVGKKALNRPDSSGSLALVSVGKNQAEAKLHFWRAQVQLRSLLLIGN